MNSPLTSTGHKLITCLIPVGVAQPLAKRLKEEKNVGNAHIGNARGIGKLTATMDRKLGDQAEKQILTVVVDQERADDIFSFIYFEAQIDQPHGGLIFMSAADRFVPLTLPDIPEEED